MNAKTAFPPRLLAALKFYAAGYDSKDVADELGVSVGTLKLYRQRICDRLHAANFRHALVLAHKAGLLDEPLA